jgi:ornithine cyclodeaminase
MSLRIATDADVRAMPAITAVETMRQVLVSADSGRLASPPRVRAELGELNYVYTVGQLADGTSGFRVYRAGRPSGDQLTAVWEPDGRLSGIVVGGELGARRTGAIGGVAADLLAREDAASVGLIGAGTQAWTQLWAICAVREIDTVRVHSRAREHREAFATRARAELGLSAQPAATAREAASEAAIVVLATTSRSPVIEAADIAPGTHVTTVGPKSVGGHETPVELAATAAVIACDSPAQAGAYGEPFFTGDAPLTDLAAIASGRVPGRSTREEITLYCSVGLAGTEVALAARLLDGL